MAYRLSSVLLNFQSTVFLFFHYLLLSLFQVSFLLPTADCRLPIADCRLPIADCRLPTANCRLPIADCQLPTADCRLPIADCRLYPHPNHQYIIKLLFISFPVLNSFIKDVMLFRHLLILHRK